MRKAKPFIIAIFVALLIFAAVFAFFIISAEPTVTPQAVHIENETVEISIQVLAPRKIIEAVRIDNLGGKLSHWRSDGQEGTDPLLVRYGNTELTSGSAPMSFKAGIFGTLLSLRFQDNGAFSGKNTDFRITVFFSDGGRALCELSAEQISRPFTPAVTPETDSERWTLMDFIVGVLVGIVILAIVGIVLGKLGLLALGLAKLGLVASVKEHIVSEGKTIISREVKKITEADDVKGAIKERVNAISQAASDSAKRGVQGFINTQKKNGEDAENIGRREKEREDGAARQAEEKRKERRETIRREKEARELKFKKQKRTDEARRNEFFELCEHGTWEEITAAVENGADLNMKNSEGLRAFMAIAGKNQNPEVITNLIEQVEDISCLTYAVAQNPNPEVLAVLLEAGADINEANDDGLTPLMLTAANNPNPDVLKVLLESGGDINVRDDEGCPLLMLAAKNNPSPAMLQFFIESGADLDEEFEGLTPLMMAVAYNPNPEVVMVLIRDDRERQKALIQAKKRKRQDVLEALIGN